MPYSDNIVYETSDLPDKPSDSITDDTYLLRVQGGNGGNFGEKGYKGELFFSKTRINDIQNITVNSLNFSNFNYSTIGEESDAGYAIRQINDAQNSCNLTIAPYSPVSSLNIYASGAYLKFNDLYSGVASSATALNDGDSFGDFVVLTSTSITPILDSSLSLNKYYLPLHDPQTILKRSLLVNNAANPSSTRTSDSFENVFIFYVLETDILDQYWTFSVSDFNCSTSSVIEVDDVGSFQNGDRIRISHPLGFYYAEYDIDSVSAPNITVLSSDKVEINFPSSTEVLFPVGSPITVVNKKQTSDSAYSRLTDSSIFATISETHTLSKNSYTPLFENRASNYGFSATVSKSVSSSDKELSNALTVQSDACFANSFPQSINYVSDRVFSRQYSQDQYGADSTKLAIKNKTKLSLLYHGLQKRNNQYYYVCGNETKLLKNQLLPSQDGSLINFLNGNANYLLVGAPVSVAGSDLRLYSSLKLYEVLVYHNLDFRSSFNPIELIKTSLIQKYKERLFFSPSVEIQSSDMYYSKTDRINILGKVKKS